MILEIKEYTKRTTAINTPSFWENKDKVFYIDNENNIKAVHKEYFITYECMTTPTFEIVYNSKRDPLIEITQERWLHFVELMLKDTEEKFINNLKQRK